MERFNGIPLIKRPKEPSYNFLVGDFGEEVVNEYNSIGKSKFKNNPNLEVLNFKDGLVKGSNSFAVFLMNNEVLPKYGLRTTNSADVHKVINNYASFLSGVYVDLGVVLRTEYGANGYLAKQLAKQAKDRKYEFSNLSPLVFKPGDLELIVDGNSPCGLGFKIRESANPFNAWELSSKNEEKIFKNTNENGVPIFDKYGNRTNHTTDNGLSGFGLFWGSNLDSEFGNLAQSIDSGRIVVIDDGGKK
jgi:hypothetical protein